MKDTRGLIIDLRGNSGGETEGRGVIPDIEVHLRRSELVRRRDAQLEELGAS